jgi:hypothetical protein
MGVAAPGKFEPGATMKGGDFAVALQRFFNLPQSDKTAKFSDVHPADASYAAVEAVAPCMDKEVPCPNCELGSNFSPGKSLSRAQWAITVVRILVGQKKLQLPGEQQSDKVLTSVPDARNRRKRAVLTSLRQSTAAS